MCSPQTDFQSRPKIHIVMGNESCDLDSTVSAITYAYFLHEVSHCLYVLLLHKRFTHSGHCFYRELFSTILMKRLWIFLLPLLSTVTILISPTRSRDACQGSSSFPFYGVRAVTLSVVCICHHCTVEQSFLPIANTYLRDSLPPRTLHGVICISLYFEVLSLWGSRQGPCYLNQNKKRKCF